MTPKHHHSSSFIIIHHHHHHHHHHCLACTNPSLQDSALTIPRLAIFLLFLNKLRRLPVSRSPSIHELFVHLGVTLLERLRVLSKEDKESGTGDFNHNYDMNNLRFSSTLVSQFLSINMLSFLSFRPSFKKHQLVAISKTAYPNKNPIIMTNATTSQGIS